MLGLSITPWSQTEAIHQLTVALQQPRQQPLLVCTPNPEIMVYAHRHPAFKKVLQQADVLLPDGQGLVWFSRGQLPERVTGSDVMLALLEQAHQAGWSVGVRYNPTGLSSLTLMQHTLTQRFPGCHWQFSTDQFTTPAPRLVLVSLGFPEQEQWALQQRDQLPGTQLIMTVGGAIDFLTGAQRRAPLFFRRFGLEWLWRLVHQPGRWRRIINATIVFPWLVVTKAS